MPIKINEDLLSYKIYMSDVGLLSNSLGLNIASILSENLSSEAKGALAGNYVMQQLSALGFTPYYWESDGKAEVDFVIQTETKVVPVECKFAENVQTKSLNVFVKKIQPPIFYSGFLARILGLKTI